MAMNMFLYVLAMPQNLKRRFRGMESVSMCWNQ